ncbi:MAG: acetyltransferase [Salibacteraceae bacterium]
MSETAIYGIGGHARSVCSLLMACGYAVKGYYHPNGKQNEYLLGTTPFLGAFPNDQEVVIAIGDNEIRADLMTQLPFVKKEMVAHPTSHVDDRVIFGDANTVFAQAYIGPEVSIGNNNILNTGCIVEHEVKIGSHNHISIGSILAGRVTIGDRCFIGAGAVIKNKVTIGSDITIGAGAVVVKDILDPGVYVGNPAKPLR